MSFLRFVRQAVKGRIKVKSALLLLVLCLTLFIILKSVSSKRQDVMDNTETWQSAFDGKHREKTLRKTYPNLVSVNDSVKNEALTEIKNIISENRDRSLHLEEVVRNTDNLSRNSAKVANVHKPSKFKKISKIVRILKKTTVPKVERKPLDIHDIDKDVERNSCIHFVSIYIPHMQPLKAWREYVFLDEGFRGAKNKSSPYYDPRITQHEKFPTMFIKCPGYQCDVALQPTVDKEFLARSDAVVINMAPNLLRHKMTILSEELVKTLPVGGKVFFYAMESPMMMSYWDHTIKDIKYHESMTYVSGSDVHLPYGRYIDGTPMDTKDINYAENKTGLLVWTASNCNNTFWPRLEWVRNLEQLLVFDTFGKCGLKTCLPPLSPICTKQQAVYKFYLALENAECDEYITEKVWVNGLMNGVVPIVYGGRREAYDRLLPPKSFIHLADFSSQRALVDYLLILDKNDTLYNEFFAWRRHGRVEKIYPNLSPKSFCNILPKLMKHETPSPVKRVGDSIYFQTCRGEVHGSFTHPGDIHNWSPWK